MSKKIFVRTFSKTAKPEEIEVANLELDSLEDIITAPNAKRAISTLDLFSHDPDLFPKNDWLIEGLLHQFGLWVMAGLPKHTKSVTRAHVAACVATGAPFFGRKVKRGKVLILADEDTLLAERRRITRLAQAMGHSECDLVGRIIHIPPQNLQLDQPDDMQILRAIIKHLDISLTIIDPLIRYHTCEENDATSMQKVMRPLSTLARTHCVGVVHHTDKKGKGPRGTGDLLASYTSKWHLKAAKEADPSSLRINFALKLASAPDDFRVGYLFDDAQEKITILDLGTAPVVLIKPNYRQKILKTIQANGTPLLNKEAVLKATTGKREKTSQAFDDLLNEGRIEVTDDGVIDL